MSYSAKDFYQSYPYRKDPREQQLSYENHTYWEEDNRVEERYQWGAQILDLCDMSVEEYMKNPFVDGIKEAIAEAMKDITVNVELSGITVEVVISGCCCPSGETKEINFYYASINQNTPSDEITFDMFTEATAKPNEKCTIYFTLGNPNEDDINYLKDNNYSEEAKKEVMADKANTYYLLIPENYASITAMSIKEEDWFEQNEDVVQNMPMADKPEGYTLIGVVDDDNFNIQWPIVDTVTTKYVITYKN